MSLPTISPTEARRLLNEGATLVDIREADEHARENIPGARHLPLSKLDEADLALHAGRPVIFHCRSGARTQSQAPRLAGRAAGACEAFILEGGIERPRPSTSAYQQTSPLPAGQPRYVAHPAQVHTARCESHPEA